MAQDVKIQQVASFQVYVRDNKPKMNAYYPFLSQEQILSKLRQQWKELDDSKRRPYSKLVLTKKKVFKTTKVNVVKITRHRIPKNKQIAISKNVDVFRNDDDGFEFDNFSDDSHIYNDYELDRTGENSPFMRNKFAIDSLNAGFCRATNEPTENMKKCASGKTYEGHVFKLQHPIPRVTSETVDISKTGILRRPCKNRRHVQDHVSFSAVQGTVNDNSYEFDDEDIDEEVLYVESSKRRKTGTSCGSICRNKFTDGMSRRVNLKEVEGHSLTLGFQNTPASKYSPAVGEFQTSGPREQLLNVKNTENNLMISSANTSSIFSKRLRNLSPDDVSTTPRGSSGPVHLRKKPRIASELCNKKTFSVKNNKISVEREDQLFFSKALDLSTEAKVNSSVCDSRKMLTGVQDGMSLSGYKADKYGNFNREHKLNNELKNKADVNRNSLSVKSGTHMLEGEADECVASIKAITRSNQRHCPLSTGSCSRSARQKNDSAEEACLKTSTGKISQKVTCDFSGKGSNTHWKDVNRFRVSDEDSEFDNTGSCDKNDTVSQVLCHARKKNDSADEAYLKTTTRKKSEILAPDFFGWESNIHRKEVDSSDEENDSEFDNKGNYKNDIAHRTPHLANKQHDSVFETYFKKSTIKTSSFSGSQSNVHRKHIDSNDEENDREFNEKGSHPGNDSGNNLLRYRSKQNAIQAYSGKSTMKESEKNISELSGKESYIHNKDTGIYKERDKDSNSESVDITGCYRNDVVKNIPISASIYALRSKLGLQSVKENNCYQAKQITDLPLAVYTNNTTGRDTTMIKVNRQDKIAKPKHDMVSKSKTKKVSDEILVEDRSDLDSVEDVECKSFKAKNGFLWGYSKSAKKQQGKSKKESQKKSAINHKTTSLNYVLCRKNKSKQITSFASVSENYSAKTSSKPPVPQRYELNQRGSHLHNSSTKQYKHMQEFGGHQSPSCIEAPTFDVKLQLPSDLGRGSSVRLQHRLFPEVDCRNSCNADCRNNSKMDCTDNSKMDCRENSKSDCRENSKIDCKNISKISWKAQTVFNSDLESDTSDNSFGSETDEDEEKKQDDFLVNITNQTTLALLQAIERLKSLSSPEMNLNERWEPDGAPSDLSEPENNDLASVSTEQHVLCNMFQDITQNVNSASFTPAKQRLLASSATETPSNFLAMFDDGDIFL